MSISKFGREITLILVVKLVLMYGFWMLCFKDTKQRIAGIQLAQHVY